MAFGASPNREGTGSTRASSRTDRGEPGFASPTVQIPILGTPTPPNPLLTPRLAPPSPLSRPSLAPPTLLPRPSLASLSPFSRPPHTPPSPFPRPSLAPLSPLPNGARAAVGGATVTVGGGGRAAGEERWIDRPEVRGWRRLGEAAARRRHPAPWVVTCEPGGEGGRQGVGADAVRLGAT